MEDAETNNGKSSKCLEVVYSILDGEATDEDIKYFEENIKCCDKSMAEYNLSKCLKEVLRDKLQKKEVSQDLIDCIKNKLKNLNQE